MTHIELRASYPPSTHEPTACPGETDTVLDEVDPVDGHRVRVHVCRLCGNTIVVDETAARIRNDYRAPAPWGAAPP